MKEEEEVMLVFKKSRKEVGSCMACKPEIHPITGNIIHSHNTVLVFRLAASEIRLCREHASNLASELKKCIKSGVISWVENIQMKAIIGKRGI